MAGADHDSGPTGTGRPGWRCLEAVGPWPFVTRRLFEHEDRTQHVWASRAHRKRLVSSISLAHGLEKWIWAPRQLNWWIACLFMLGAFLFALGCVLSLVPSLVTRLSLNATEVNALYFAGSIPFTSAAYLQLFQAANAPTGPHPDAQPPARRSWFGWRPRQIGWLSCALQFPGTVLFNLNTFDALIPGLTWLQQDLAIWVPDLVGSILFLVSGYLAFIETCHAHWAWKPQDLSWWVTFINLLGCIGFMVAALLAFVWTGPPHTTRVTYSILFTLQGAACFFGGSFLMLLESAGSVE